MCELVCGRADRMLRVLNTGGQAGSEGARAELVAVIGEHALEARAGVLELGGDARGQRAGVLDGKAGRRE